MNDLFDCEPEKSKAEVLIEEKIETNNRLIEAFNIQLRAQIYNKNSLLARDVNHHSLIDFDTYIEQTKSKITEREIWNKSLKSQLITIQQRHD